MSNENKPNYEVKIPLEVDGNWEYFPICNPASETTKGTVLLSDLYDNSVSNLDTASSTAFTPKGANDLYKDVKANMLSKTATEEKQTVAGKILFNESLEFNDPIKFDLGLSNVISDNKAHIEIHGTKAAGAGETISVNIDKMTLPAGNLTGTVPLDCIPQGAIEELHRYSSLQAAIDEYKKVAGSTEENKVYPYEIGDTILVTGTTPNVMYIAVGPNLTMDDGYVEYASGTAMRLGASDIGSNSQPIYLVGGQPRACADLTPMSDDDIDATFTLVFG